MNSDIQAFFGSWNLKPLTNGSELRFCCTGEIEALRFAFVPEQETTQTFLFVDVQKVEYMRSAGSFRQISCPCSFSNGIPGEIKHNAGSNSEDVHDERFHN
jgi:hypothetical protein